MADSSQDLSAPRPGCSFVLLGCAGLVLLFTGVLVLGATMWLIPDAAVSTLPSADSGESAPPPALLLHMTSAPEIITLLNESMGSEAIVITSMMPYEGTFTVTPRDTDTAVADVKLNVPRSAAALQVLLRAQIGLPTPMGYVLRSVERSEASVIHVVMEGPMAESIAPENYAPAAAPSESLTVPNAFSMLSLHNEDGAWSRIAARYIEAQDGFVLSPTLDWAQLVSAELAAEFVSLDEIVCHGVVRCATHEVAVQLAQAIDDAIRQAEALDTSGLHYGSEIAVNDTEVRGFIQLRGVRTAAHTIAEAYRTDE